MSKWGRPLNEVELDSYDLVDRALAENVRIFKTLYIPGGFHGICLVNWIFFTRDVADDGKSALLAHELIHVRQWNERGVAGYLIWYLRSFGGCLRRHGRWMKAYNDIEAELEAKQEARDWYQRRNAIDRRSPE